jgi:uncharacterized protein (DUF488 family)
MLSPRFESIINDFVPATPKNDTWAEDQESRGYYYDDAHGYESYDPKRDVTLWTIGHSTREFEEMVGLLAENKIELLVDVRSFPGSRKFPQFNTESLKQTLPEHGVEYLHLKELGGRRRAKPDSKNTSWRSEAFRGYADYMETEDFRKGIDELIDLAEEKRVAIMCSEAVWWRCHRSMIADFLKAAGVRVLHIMGDRKVAEHPYTSAARIVDGRLTYAA